MSKSTELIIVGTVVGVSSADEFEMQVKPDQVQVQDIVALDVIEDGVKTRTWARISSIERSNPLFPREAAQELAYQGRDPIDSVMSLSREMITARCRVAGVERAGVIEPPRYPVMPASKVYIPPAAEVEAFLTGNVAEHVRLHIGSLRGNAQVNVYVNGFALASRHLAVLASTGAGKTVATRRLLEQLMERVGLPILVFDPHGDYRHLQPIGPTEVLHFKPEISLEEESFDQVLTYVLGFSGQDMTANMEAMLEDVYWALKKSSKREQLETACQLLKVEFPNTTLANEQFNALGRYSAALRDCVDKGARNNHDVASWIRDIHPSVPSGLVNRLRSASSTYRDMMEVAARRDDEQPLPRGRRLSELVAANRVSVLSLEGYNTEIQQSLVAGILRRLFKMRVKGEVPEFLTVLEEAHTFIPRKMEGDTEAPSLRVVRQIATEGRKYGMGLVFVSQRPSRVDDTVLSQANSYLILRIVNPSDQRYIRDVVESLGEDEARSLPSLATGEALLSGSFVPMPLMVRVRKGVSVGAREEVSDFFRKFVDLRAETTAETES